MPLGGQVELRPALQGAYKVYLCIVGCYLVISKCPKPPGNERKQLKKHLEKLNFGPKIPEIGSTKEPL